MCTYLDTVGSTYYFRRPVPKDLLGHFTNSKGNPQTDWKVSLRTKDRETAKRLLPAHVAQTNELIDDASRELALSAPLSPEELAAQQREREEQAARAAAERAQAVRRANPSREAERIRLRQLEHESTAAMSPEDAARIDILRERSAQAVAARATAGAASEPATAPIRAGSGKRKAPVSVTALLEDWAGTFGKPDTVAAYRSYLGALDNFVGKADANDITEDDVGDWRNHLRVNGGLSGKPVSANTINGAYMAAVNAVFEHARGATRRLAHNPAAGLKALRMEKRQHLRPKSITDDEAVRLLQDTMQPGGAKLSPPRRAAKRWCQWLMAYTGARVLEIAQLRKEDVGTAKGIPYIRITPEAGTNKTERARMVPLHPHLVQQSFLAFVAAQGAGPLFYDPEARRGGRGASQAKKVGQYLCRQVRDVGIDVSQPNHGWRHRMETMNNRHDLRDKTVRMILGHSATDSNAMYGDHELGQMLREIEKLPAYEGEGLPPFDPETGEGSDVRGF